MGTSWDVDEEMERSLKQDSPRAGNVNVTSFLVDAAQPVDFLMDLVLRVGRFRKQPMSRRDPLSILKHYDELSAADLESAHQSPILQFLRAKL